MKVAGLVLAAGGGSRLGRPKAEVVFDGRRLVDLAIQSCARAGLSPVIVVLGATWPPPPKPADAPGDDTPSDGNLPHDSPSHDSPSHDSPSHDSPSHDSPSHGSAEVRFVENADWASGIASSVRAGLAVLRSDLDVDAVVISLVDTPSVGEKHLGRIASALREDATAAVATYEGRARTPVGLGRAVWAEVAVTVTGDEGARGWLRTHPHLVTEVECGDLGPWTDIDIPADLPGDFAPR